MITKALWGNLFYEYSIIIGKYTTNLRVMGCLIFSIFTIPLDIILLPLEIITIIIKFIINGK